jgi:hypothetical protein
MRALGSFAISILFFLSSTWTTAIDHAHAASCPANGAYAGIKIWHYLESTAGIYTQTTEYEGTVSIQFVYRGTEFFIENVGNYLITKKVDAKQDSPYWKCTYETAQADVNVRIDSNSKSCDDNDGILFMKIIEEADEASVDYHCVDGEGNVYGPFTQFYPATRLEHDVKIEYSHETMVQQQFPQGTGDYSWTLLFRESPIPLKGHGLEIVPLLPLLLSE